MLIIPLIAAVLSLLLPIMMVRWGAVAAAGGTGVLALIATFAPHLPLTWSVIGVLRLDAMSAVFLLTVALVYTVAAVFSAGYINHTGVDRGLRTYTRQYYALFHLFGCTMLAVPLIDNLATLWIAIELTTIVSALLIAIEGTGVALEAAWKYALIASSGLGLALFGVVVLYAAGSHTLGGTYEPNWTTLMAVAPHLPGNLVILALLLAVAGFGSKAGLVPMHTWLPDAHSEAPSAVSGMLSGALLADAMYGIFRFSTIADRATGQAASQRILLAFGLMSLLAAAFFVLRQSDYKRLLAYSSIEHMGILALAASFGTPIALYGLFMHVINHGAAKSLVFFSSGSVLRKYGTKEIEEVGGVLRTMPWTGPAMVAGALAMSGFPPFGIFRSELLIIAGGLGASSTVPVALFLIGVNIAFLGVGWAFTRMAYGPGGALRALLPGEVSGWIVAALVLDLVVVVGIGLYVPGPLSDLLRHAADILGGRRL